jgi:magnesium transporter
MPSLPRIRRTRARDTVVTASAPQSPPAELSAAGLTWIHLDAPSLVHAQELADTYGWHPLDVEDVMSKRQRPKVDDYTDEGYLFAVLHFPVYDRAIQRLNAAELDVFVGPNYLVTLPTVELLPITRLFRRSEEVVRDISNVKQEIISYRKIIKPERSTLRVLERHVERFLPEELELYFDDIVDAAERIWDYLDNYKEVVEALEDTNESVIAHRQNDVLRILTVFSVVLLPLTLITGFFGMNVRFPGFDTAWAFWVIFVGMVGTLAGLLAFFRLKRWL